MDSNIKDKGEFFLLLYIKNMEFQIQSEDNIIFELQNFFAHNGFADSKISILIDFLMKQLCPQDIEDTEEDDDEEEEGELASDLDDE
jgi:hypothetical protein